MQGEAERPSDDYRLVGIATGDGESAWCRAVRKELASSRSIIVLCHTVVDVWLLVQQVHLDVLVIGPDWEPGHRFDAIYALRHAYSRDLPVLIWPNPATVVKELALFGRRLPAGRRNQRQRRAQTGGRRSAT